MNRLVLCVLISLPIALANCQAKNDTGGTAESQVPAKKLLSSAEFEQLSNRDDAVVIDVRTPGEVAQGYIEGAVFLDYQKPSFQQDLQALDKSKTYLVYCAVGGRSKSTQQIMEQMGFTRVYDLQGGIRGWQKAGKAIVK